MSCYIQKLEQVKDGWHIRFGGKDDCFWTMLSNFKTEQRRRGQVKADCYYDPKFFNKQGGWFCTEDILLKYSSEFENYAEMRQKAETVYAESGKAEQARKEREAEEKRKRYWEEEQERARRERQRPTRPPSTALTLTEAKVELGLSLAPLAQLTEKEVKKAFRLKAMEVHPDHGGSHAAMVKLNQAYQLVMFHVVKVGVR
jgi:hypothetical protein